MTKQLRKKVIKIKMKRIFLLIIFLSQSIFEGLYEQLNDLKVINPSLKTLLAVGGWNMGSKPFSDMSRDEKHRMTFANSTIKFLRKWRFDGLGFVSGNLFLVILKFKFLTSKKILITFKI